MRLKMALYSLLTIFVALPARGDTSVQVLMRQKLESAHGVLDALTLGDFAKIETFAGRLREVSRATTWHRQDNEEFMLFAKSFQNSADYLAERARDKDLEGVSLGYIRMTLDCIRCHNVVRAAGPKK